MERAERSAGSGDNESSPKPRYSSRAAARVAVGSTFVATDGHCRDCRAACVGSWRRRRTSLRTTRGRTCFRTTSRGNSRRLAARRRSTGHAERSDRAAKSRRLLGIIQRTSCREWRTRIDAHHDDTGTSAHTGGHFALAKTAWRHD